jgi:hypothetical protein
MSRYEPTTLGICSTLPRREDLFSQYDGELWHACYPTGRVTLCGLDKLDASTNGTTYPTCPVCAPTAARFHEIDRSAPLWFATAEAA